MFKWIISCLLLGSVAFGAQINWAKDFQSGMALAKGQNKPVLFVFSRHTCKYCVLLEETTFKDQKVIEMLNSRFVPIISYTDENDYTPNHLYTPGTPAIWFLYPSSEPMFQPLMGAVDAQNFLKALTIVDEEFKNSTNGKAK
ncbi:MAG: thioredoxin family protein [Thiovulaceae bacterium]|nr:thioredoxin family protein [Sulfurimonadaceae bacterium]MDD3817844.1 thioredoxin family protein [Sulfurimonadaceae bacterium]